MMYLDTNIILYAIGSDPVYSKPCVQILRDIEAKRLIVGASSLVLLEIVGALRKLNGTLKRKRQPVLDIQKNMEAILSLPIVWFDLSPIMIERTLDYMNTSLHTADATHCATALSNDMTTIISADKDFDAFSGITRLDPLDYS